MTRQWPTVQLSTVLSLDLDRVAVDPAMTYPMVGILSFGRGLFDREPISDGRTSYRVFYRLKTDHLVMSQLFGWEGALALSAPKFAGKFVSPQFPTFLCDSTRLHREFLGWFIRRQAFWEDLGRRASGMGDRRRTLTPDALLACQIPLPPLAEQRRVAARIHEVVVEIQEAHGLRRRAAEEANALMSSHLGAEFAALAKRFPVYPLGELASRIVDGPHQTPHYLPEGVAGIPFITVKNMVTGTLSFTDLNYISEEDHRSFTKRCKAEQGDVLYSKDGATRGRPCLVATDREFSYFVSVALIKPLRDRLDGRYLVHLLGSTWITDRMIDRSRGDMIPHIVLREIHAYPVPLPPLVEQRRIVAELDALQACVGQLGRLQAEAAAELDALLPAFLDRAFKGRL